MGVGPSIYDLKFQFHNAGMPDVNFEPAHEDGTGVVKYYGFISSFGSWIIMAMDTTNSPKIIYKYVAGQKRTDYDAHWGADGTFIIGTLSFVTFDLITP